MCFDADQNHKDIYQSANYSFSATSANEWLTIFYSRVSWVAV